MDPVEALLGPRPYNDPPPIPAEVPADASVAALLEALRSADYSRMRASARAVAEAGSPSAEAFVLETLEKLVEGWNDGFYAAELYTQHSAKPEIHAEYSRWYKAMIGRSHRYRGAALVLGMKGQ